MKNKNGFTLVEIMVALSILLAALLSYSTLNGVLIKSQSNSYAQSIALYLASEKIEKTIGLPFDSISSGETSESNIQLSSDHPELYGLKTAFTRKTSIINGSPSADLKSITVSVVWKDAGRLSHSVSLNTAIGK